MDLLTEAPSLVGPSFYGAKTTFLVGSSQCHNGLFHTPLLLLPAYKAEHHPAIPLTGSSRLA